jgi:two-component system, chemotaxis family, sensor kinase CheA
MTDSHDADLLNIFWVEVGDYLQILNSTLLQIEAATVADESDVLREMNRVAHSMKGAARAVGINVIETIAYYMEEIFEAALNKRLKLTPTVCDLVYDGLDLIQNVVNGVENNAETLSATLTQLEQTVVSVAKPPKKKSGEMTIIQPVETPAVPAEGKTIAPVRQSIIPPDNTDSGTLQLRPAEESVRVPVSRLDRLMGGASELLVARMHSEEHLREFQRLQKLNQRWQREWRAIRTAYIRLARRLQNEPDETPDEVITLFKFLETNQRYLMEANRQLGQLTRELAQYNAQFALLSEQMQQDISGMRLVPFETLIGSFQRLVRDLSRDTNKEVHLDVNGATVEMDKTALDGLKEPIMHLLRNAVDHGIESPEDRHQNGKLATGRVVLSIEQRGKEIVVRVSDDGRGLDSFRIGRAAVRAGLLSSQEVNTLTPEEANNLIFHPGLTTTDHVTALSGRGMGMDIVRTRVESLGGRVTVRSAPGKGTTFTLRFPVSLVRLSCVLLRLGGQDFAVPSTAVARMVTVTRDQLFTAEGREMMMLNERPVPVVALDSLLGLPASPLAETDEITLLVLAVGERSAAFEVDMLFSEQELVLKPLGPEIAKARYISGAALLGGGEIVIILDPNDLIRGAAGLPNLRSRPVFDAGVPNADEGRLSVLIVDDSITTRTLEKHILETAGFEVQVAIDGVEAWEKLGERDFDAVIADVEMPRMDGLELTERIKADSQLERIPVILLTSLSKPEQREAGLKAGADAYLVKSRFDQGELLKVIRALV